MTISSTTRKAGPFSGNGTTTAFPFSFKVFQASDLLVTLTDSSGNEVTQTLTSQYTATLNGNQDSNPGGTVTMISAPASGYTLTIGSQIPYSQSTVLTNLGGFYPTVINDALDKATALIQQQQEQLSRSIKFPKSDSSSLSPTLPSALVRANKYLVFDSSGNVSTSSSDVATLANQATTAAAAAATSATAAATSASASAASASAAAGTYANVQIAAASVAPTAAQFSGTGSQTQFTLPYAVTTKNLIDVYISGMYQQKATYAVSGTTLTFTSPPPLGSNNIEVMTAANVTYTLPVTQDYGLITSSATAFSDYGALN